MDTVLMSASPLTRYRIERNLTLEQAAAQLGVQKAAVWKWERHGVPVKRVLHVESVTGISRHELCPRFYPREESAA